MKKDKKQKDWIKYYEDRDILKEVTERDALLKFNSSINRYKKWFIAYALYL